MGAAMGGMSLQDQLARKLQERNKNSQSANTIATDSSK